MPSVDPANGSGAVPGQFLVAKDVRLFTPGEVDVARFDEEQVRLLMRVLRGATPDTLKQYLAPDTAMVNRALGHLKKWRSRRVYLGSCARKTVAASLSEAAQRLLSYRDGRTEVAELVRRANEAGQPMAAELHVLFGDFMDRIRAGGTKKAVEDAAWWLYNEYDNKYLVDQDLLELTL